MRATIGALIHLGAIFGAIALTIRLTDERDPITGRNRLGWPKRTAIVIGAIFVTSLVVVPVLRVAGLRPDTDESYSEQLRNGLEAGGYSAADIDCVEDRLIRDYGNLENAWDANENDAKVMLSLMMSCNSLGGMNDQAADCFADGIADRFGEGEIDAVELASIANSAESEDRQAMTEIGFVCQGAPPEVARCVIDALVAEYPNMFEPKRLEPLSATQQQFMYQAAEQCAQTES